MEQFKYPKYKFFENKLSAEKFLADEINNYIKTKPNSILSFEANNEFFNLYNLISEKAKQTQTTYKDVIFFCPSEVCPSDTNNINLTSYNFLSENFVSKIDANWNNFLCMFDPNIAQTPNTELLEFEQYIIQQGNIDILILSVGNDGSLLMNFPLADSNSKTRTISINEYYSQNSNSSEKNDCWATLGLKTISNSKKIYILMFGSDKKEILSNFFFGDGFDPNLPISCLRNNSNTIIIADTEAAEIILMHSEKSNN